MTHQNTSTRQSNAELRGGLRRVPSGSTTLVNTNGQQTKANDNVELALAA
jgi:hypothetical protein